MNPEKAALRKNFLAQRRSLSKTDWRNHSELLCNNLAQQQSLQNAQTVLSYCTYRNEPDLSLLFELLGQKSWGLPRCVGKDLAWHQYRPGDRLISGKYNITEPHPDLPLLDLSTIDLILVPAVACTKTGDRLGYGGGFYDRFFATLSRKVTTIGIVFNCCLAETLPIEPWDKSLDYVCTETDFYDCR